MSRLFASRTWFLSDPELKNSWQKLRLREVTGASFSPQIVFEKRSRFNHDKFAALRRHDWLPRPRTPPVRHQFDQHTGIGVTSAVAWSPGAGQFIYGTYEGTVVAANTPAP
jgi:hypothetical protein